MHLIKSAVIAFSMYSRIPMPQFTWEDKDMRWVFCFFPLVGLLLGFLFLTAFLLFTAFGLPELLRAAALAALPLLLTGGIHMDGFLDTSDALACLGEREKKLEVLRDSHVGAFALIHGLIYMTLWAGAAGSLKSVRQTELMAVCFVLSRAFSGLTFVHFPDARGDGLKTTFTKSAGRMAVSVCCVCYLAAGFGLLVWLDARAAFWLFAAALALLLYYARMSRKQFGGLTGDLAGFYLQLQELSYLLVVVCCAA